MKKHPIVTIALVLLFVLLTPIVIVSLPWVILLIFSVLEPNPPEPVITYGEFPFRLEYKIDGETVVIEDVIICEYCGGSSAIGDNSRVWSKILKNNSNLVIFEDDNVRISCDLGAPEYYMGDPEYRTSEEPQEPYFYIYNKRPKSNPLNTQQLIELYKVELVDAKLSEPIENSFKGFWGRITDG